MQPQSERQTGTIAKGQAGLSRRGQEQSCGIGKVLAESDEIDRQGIEDQPDIAFRRAIAGEVPDHRGYRYLSTDLREVSQLLAACRRDADKLSLPRG